MLLGSVWDVSLWGGGGGSCFPPLFLTKDLVHDAGQSVVKLLPALQTWVGGLALQAAAVRSAV